MDIYNQLSLFAPLFITITISLFLGLYVFLNNPGKRENRALCFLILLHCLGQLFFLLQNCCPTLECANLYSPLITIITVWLNGLALIFVVTALYYLPFWENKKKIYLFVSVAVFFSIFTFLDYVPGVDLFTKGAYIKDGRYTIDYSSWGFLLIIWMFTIGFFILWYLIRGYKEGNAIIRRQIRLLGITFILVSVISFFFNQHFIAGPLRFTDFVWMPFDLIFAYVILRHKFIPIDQTLNVLSETIGEGFILCNPDGLVSTINKRAIKILGLDSKENLLNKGWDVVISSSPDALSNPYIIKEMNQRLQEDPAQTLDIEILFSQPRERFIHIFTSSLMDNNGRLLGRFFILTDLTSKRKAEKRLKLSEEKYRNLVESANDAIISMDKNSIIRSFNRKAEEVYGFSREEIVGKSILTLVPESYREKIKKLLDDFLRKGKSELAEKILVEPALRKDGREIVVEITFSSTPAEEDQLFTVIARDVTERKEMEEKLIRSEKLRALGELAGGVAHDFNNILAAILGRSQLLKTILSNHSGKGKKIDKSVFELNKGLEIIERAATDGAETVRRIQEFSRKRDDDKDFTSVDINEVVEHALEFTQVRWKDEAELKGINIRIEKNLSPIPQIAGSASELREVIINLINNSIEAMPRGGQITIKTFRDNGHVGIRIGDTGEGVPQVLKDRIFDPFFTTKGPQATGLGLSVSYGIVNRHRGTISVDSIDNKGATFTIKLLILKAKIDAKEVRYDAREKEIKKAAILVVEDEKEVSDLLCDILADCGHRVETADDGSKGLEIFKKGCFDVVFTDLGMPGLSGWQVAQGIKKMNTKTPVVLITGWEIRLSECELKEKGVDLVVSKPFRVEGISKSVQEAMEIGKRLSKVSA